MNSYEEIYVTVGRIPHGRVCSYGRIAALAGHPNQARLVGYALHALRTNGGQVPGQAEVPWWRVINIAGYISNAYESDLQRARLEAEGIVVDERDHIDLARYLWDGDGT